MKIILLCSLYAIAFLGIFAKISPKVLAKGTTCHAIAKVISSSNPNYRFGTTICFGRNLRISQQSSLEIACINSIYSFKAVSPNDIYQCPVSKYIEKPKMPDDFRSVLRSPENELVVIRPYGLNQIKSNPELQWLPINKADSYRVVVDDWNRYWLSINTTIPSAQLPKLTSGTYQVLISALNRGKTIGQTTISIVILSSERVEEANKLLLNIDSLNDSNSQKIVYKLGILARFNLLEESITYLSKYLAINKLNMFLTRTLGDLYLETSDPQQAYKAYSDYQAIAHTNSSSDDMISANERLQLVASFAKFTSH